MLADLKLRSKPFPPADAEIPCARLYVSAAEARQSQRPESKGPQSPARRSIATSCIAPFCFCRCLFVLHGLMCRLRKKPKSMECLLSFVGVKLLQQRTDQCRIQHGFFGLNSHSRGGQQ